MKKLCALVLALVMTLGLATVSTNAAFEGETFNFNEAVDVMAAVGVFKGDENGKFNPSNSLDRASAAKLIAYLDLGEKVAEALPQAQMFSDVPANHWASKYIAYCAQSGYVSGYEGKFFPAGELNGYAFGKMILCVLGYDANVEGLAGTTTWSISVAKLMESNDITDGIDTNASLTLTREQAAQYCLNALQATMVEYADKGTTIDIGGTKITTSAKSAHPITNANDNSIDNTETYNGTATVQLGEKLYSGKLAKSSATNKSGHPSVKWTYPTTDKTIGTYANAADTSFAVSSISGNLATLVGQLYAKNSSYKFDSNSTPTTYTAAAATGVNATYFATAATDAKAVLYVNGVATTTYTPVKGDVIELYTNDDNAEVIETVVINRYTLVKINKIDTNVSTTDKNDGTSAYVTLKGINTNILNDDDIVGFNTATYVKDAYAAVAFKNSDMTAIVDSYIVTPAAEGKVSAYQTSDYYTVNGTKYTTIATPFESEYKTDDYDGTYAVYADKNGFALGIIEVAAGTSGSDAVYVTKVWHVEKEDDYGDKTSTTYAQIVNMAGEASNIVIGRTTSKGEIFGVVYDGSSTYNTYKTFTTGTALYVDKTAGTPSSTSGNAYVSTKQYLVDAAWTSVAEYLAMVTEHTSDGYSTLTKYADSTDSTYNVYDKDSSHGTGTLIKVSDAKVAGVYVNSDTRYVVIDGSGSNIKVTVKDGGLSWSGTDTNATILYKESGSAKVASYLIIPAEYTAGADKNVIYVSDDNNNTSKNANGKVWTVYMTDGTETDITVPSSEDATVGKFATYTQNDNDVYDLKSVNEEALTATVAKWDDGAANNTGAFYNVKFGSLYNDKLTVTNVLGDGSGPYTINDIDASSVVVVDAHEKDDAEYAIDNVNNYNGSSDTGTNGTNQRHTYSGNIGSLEVLGDLADVYVAVLDLYITEDGAALVVVEDVYLTLDTTLASGGSAVFADGGSGTATCTPTVTVTSATTNTIVVSGTSSAAPTSGATVVVTLPSATSSDASLSATTVTLTYTTSWSTDTVTVTNGSATRTYTVSCTIAAAG